MPYEPLEQLLKDVSDEDLESLRDAILTEEGRRRSQYNLVIEAPHPPLVASEPAHATAVTRWARLLSWLAQQHGVPRAAVKRGVSIRVVHAAEDRPDAEAASLMLQEALVEAGLLLGRMPEWMDATHARIEQGAEDSVQIELWDRPVPQFQWD